MVYHSVYPGRRIWLHDLQTVYRSLPIRFHVPHAALNEIAPRLCCKTHSPPPIDPPISPRLPAHNSSQLHPILDSTRPNHWPAPHHALNSLPRSKRIIQCPSPCPFPSEEGSVHCGSGGWCLWLGKVADTSTDRFYPGICAVVGDASDSIFGIWAVTSRIN